MVTIEDGPTSLKKCNKYHEPNDLEVYLSPCKVIFQQSACNMKTAFLLGTTANSAYEKIQNIHRTHTTPAYAIGCPNLE